jgi:hypothetical protein
VVSADFNPVVETENSSHALAAVDAKLTLMKRIHSSRQRNNSMLGIDFDRPQAREMLPSQKSLNSPFQIAVGQRDRFTSHEYDTRFQIEFDL